MYLENCFKYINIPAYSDNKGQTFFSYLHSDQYAHFLYYLSNSLWKISQNKPICDKLIYLNKALNGFFYSYKGSLPDIFFLGHPVGSVLGNANYSDFLVVFQAGILIYLKQFSSLSKASFIAMSISFPLNLYLSGKKCSYEKSLYGYLIINS